MREIKFKVGDNVKVVNTGASYTTYDTMFIKLGFKNTIANPSAPEGTIGTVFGVCAHTSNNGDVCVAIRDKFGTEYLVDQRGLVLTEEKVSTTTTKITRKQLGEIYPHVCEPWRDRITQALLSQDIFNDTLEVDNKLLLKAYGQARSEKHFTWLDKVTGGVYYLNPQVELNKWYWVKKSLGQPQDALIYIQGLSRDCKGSFGFNHGGVWFSGDEERFNIYNSLERLRPAKETEVLEALKKEAIRRGLIDGDVKINRLFIIGNSFSSWDYTLMRDGIWATLIKREYVWLKTIRKGKTVIERHPEKQLVNLLSNGWKRLTESDLGQMKNELLKIKEI